MDDIAIITVYNNRELYNQMKASVEDSSAEISYHFIGIDNTDKKFSSAAAAYNYALNHKCDADVLVFCHQDIIFLDGSLNEMYGYCKNNKSTLFGAAGVKAGAKSSKDGLDRVISSMAMIKEGYNYKTLSKETTCDVQTLDECLIAGNKQLFDKLRFDESVCCGWHLYAADLSLQCIESGYQVKVFPANIVHLSGGNTDKQFYDCEKKLARKYRKKFRCLSYTCGWTYTDPLRFWLLRIYRVLRYKI